MISAADSHPSKRCVCTRCTMATGKSSLDFGSIWFPVDLIDDPLNVSKQLNGWRGRLEALSRSQGNAKSSSIRRPGADLHTSHSHFPPRINMHRLREGEPPRRRSQSEIYVSALCFYIVVPCSHPLISTVVRTGHSKNVDKC